MRPGNEEYSNTEDSSSGGMGQPREERKSQTGEKEKAQGSEEAMSLLKVRVITIHIIIHVHRVLVHSNVEFRNDCLLYAVVWSFAARDRSVANRMAQVNSYVLTASVIIKPVKSQPFTDQTAADPHTC